MQRPEDKSSHGRTGRRRTWLEQSGQRRVGGGEVRVRRQ